MSDPMMVRFDVENRIGVITIDNPPVNAMGPIVSDGIIAAVDQGQVDPNVDAMVLIGAGRSFIAGADIRQFGKARTIPKRRSYDALDESTKPVVAAIHGYALGGGLEHALACHYRIAVANAKVGLPEVQIGLIPGGGGTQRLPRLIGPKAAMEIIISGRHVCAEEAKALGIVDAIVAGADLRREAIEFAKSIASVRPIPRIRDKADRIAEAKTDLSVFDAMRESIAKKARNQKAPYYCIECVEAATKLPFAEGLQTERRLFGELENSEESKALRYAFFAERETRKLPGYPKDLEVQKISSAAVVGAGTMGGGIAMSLADSGISVKILEATHDALDKGMQRIRDNYAISVKRGSLSHAEVSRRLSLIEPVDQYEAIAGCDAVIEAVFENMDIKKEVFTRLDAIMKPGALLLTNSSALDINEIASVTKRAHDVAGAHFFAPANIMKLLEIVKGPQSSTQTIASVMQFARDVGKIGVVVGSCDGFAANRSRTPFITEMMLMLEEGPLPEQIDKVMVNFGFPLGPFAVGDLSGLDISYATRKRRAAADPTSRKLHVPDRLVEMGRKGQKTGAGWYRYEKGDRTPYRDPEVQRIITDVVWELGVERRSFTDDEILRRLMYASVNEACRILEEGRVYRASDIDMLWVSGFSFPRYRGGLMYWADTIGSREIYKQITSWHERYGPRWTPSNLLRELAASGGLLREARPKHVL